MYSLFDRWTDNSLILINLLLLLHLQMKLGLKAECNLVALKWFKYSIYPENPSLAILFTDGTLQLMKSDQDDSPILINTQLKPVDCQWNHDGTILAIAGRSSDSNPGPNQNSINFYTPLGKLIRTMKLPGNQIAGLSWEGHSLRLAFAIDSFIYLAQVKHDYMWTCFSNTLVYHFHKRNKPESYVMFWDTKNNEVNLNLSTIFIFRLFIHVAFMFMLFLV